MNIESLGSVFRLSIGTTKKEMRLNSLEDATTCTARQFSLYNVLIEKLINEAETGIA